MSSWVSAVIGMSTSSQTNSISAPLMDQHNVTPGQLDKRDSTACHRQPQDNEIQSNNTAIAEFRREKGCSEKVNESKLPQTMNKR